MKADVAQQRSLLELATVDAELSRLAHRSSHLPERAAYDRVRGEHTAASDRLGAVRIALEDLDAQITRLEAEIDAVRKREDRDRSLLSSGPPTPSIRPTCSTSWKRCSAARPAWRTRCWR